MSTVTANEVDRIVDDCMGRLTLDEKIGACLTQSWRGSIITPSVVELINDLHCGGLRIEPYTTEAAARLSYGRKVTDDRWDAPADYQDITQTYWRAKHTGFEIEASEYARRLNRLKQMAMERNSGIPLHICTDFEGDFSHDFPFGGINMFAANMGIRAAGDEQLAYAVGQAVGRQLSALGVTMLHSPVLDVNNAPENPEIAIRAFSDDPDVTAAYCVAYMQGLEDGGVVATAKHYPGRGDSTVDAHHALPVLDVSRDRLDAMELAPYRACIKAGLRAVMAAHNAYPALDDTGLPASLSRRIITDLLRGELGFRGVITTDAMGMGAIVKKWGVPVASAMALKAGCNLVLLKFDDALRSQTFFEIKRWLREGRMSEAELDDCLIPVLRMKAEQGHFATGGCVDPDQADAVIADGGIRALSRELAERSVSLLWDDHGCLPLTGKRVLAIEQLIIPEFMPENRHYHNHSFGESLFAHSLDMVNMDTDFHASEEEVALALRLAEGVETVVMTNWYWRIHPENNSHLVAALKAAGKRVVVVTNNPYPFGASPEADAVVCTYGVVPRCLEAAAAVLYGAATARGRWPLEHYRHPRLSGAC